MFYFLEGEICSLKIYSELEEEHWVTFRLDKESFLNIYALCVATSSKSQTMLDSFDSILQAGILLENFIFLLVKKVRQNKKINAANYFSTSINHEALMKARMNVLNWAPAMQS